MKLHLPKSLRTALLSCLAAISPWSLTLASGAISVGAVVFSLGAQAQDETISITADTNWDATTNHSADVTTVSGAVLKVGNGSGGAGGMSASSTVELGTLTLEDAATLNLWAWTSTDRDISTDGKVKVAGAITLDNSSIWMEDGSYYFSDVLNVKGTSTITSKWNKGVVLDAISGDADAELTLNSNGSDPNGSLFVLGDGNVGNSSFSGTLVLKNGAASADKTPTLSLNDATALQTAALKLDGYTNAILQLERVSVGAVYGAGDVVHSYQGLTGAANPVLQITGNATDAQVFSGTMASNLTWQIGDGTKDASSRFNGATLNGTLDIKAGSTAYLTGDNTFGTLTNNGTLHLSEGSSFVITSQAAYQGATITGLGVISGITGNTFSYGNGWLATYDAATRTATLDDVAVYWSDAGTDGNIEWSDSSNWSSVTVPASNQAVRLTADNAGKEISVSGNVTVKELRVYGSYTLNVSGSFASVDGYNFFEGGSITKTGIGSLSMSVADATVAPIIVSEGTLKITDTLKQVGYKANDSVDLSGLNVGANGVLSIAASGDQKAPGSGNGTNVSHITLGSDFKGVVEVRSGKLHVATTNATTTGSTYGSPSNLGGATGIRFDGGGLLITSQGEKFDNRQVFSLNLEVGSSGGYIDLFGGSGFVQDGWSATHTGTMSGSGTLTFIGMGEWVLAGSDYSKFTGSIELGDQTQRLYISSDMENVKSFSWNAAYSDAPSVVVGYGSASAVKVTVADKQNVTKGGSSILLTNDAAFTHTGGVSIADGKTLNIGSFENGSGVYNAGNVEFASASSKLAVAGNVVANITGTSAYTATCGTIEIASGSTVNDYRALTIDGDVRISGAGTYEQLGSLTINAGKTLTLSGDVTLSALTNNGTITFSALESLTLKGFSDKDSYDGSECYAIGNVTGGDTLAWNELLGMGDRTVSYDATSGILSLGAVPVLQWVDTTADDESSWGEASNWQLSGGSTQMVPLASSKVLLSADAQYSDTVTLTGDVTVGTLTVARNHNLSVAEGASATLAASTFTFENGSLLSKIGKGTLIMSLADAKAAKMNIAEGTLAISDDLGGYSAGNSSAQTAHDLTAVSGSGTLAVKLFGEETTNGRSLVSLSDSFTGILEVCAGALDRNSLLGGTSAIKLNNGGLFGRETAGGGTHDFACDIIVEGNSWLSGQGGSGKDNGNYYVNLTGDITGDGVLSIKGYCDWHFKGDMSGFTGSIKLVTGGETADWVIFHSAASFDTLTIATGNVEVDSSLTLQTLNQTGGLITVNNNASLKITDSATLKTITNSGTLNLQEADALTLVGFNDANTTVNGTQTFTLGTVQNGATMNWNALLGIDTAAADTAYYARYTNGVVSYIDLANTSLVWADTVDAESAWGEVSNWTWSDGGNNAVVPTVATNVLLTAGAAEKTLTLSGDAVAKSLTVQGAYNLHVETGQTATLTPASLVMDGDAASLTKTGEGVLSMTSTNAIAGKIAVNEGTLALTDRLRGDADQNDGAGAITYEADFSSLNVGVNGTLAINAADKTGNNRTTVKLSDSFAGTLEIVSGYVDTDSAFSGATIKVNGGGLLSRVPAGDITNNVVIGENGATFYSLGSTGVDGTWKTKFTGAFSGSGTLTIQERGDWYFTGDMSGFTGSIVLNNKYDRVFFYSSASVSSFSASDRLDENATVYFGDGTKSMEFVVNDAMTVGADTSFELRKTATFANTGVLTVNANFNVTGAGAYEMNGGLVINAGKTLTLNVAEASIASITNNGTLTLGTTLTSLSLGDFVVGTDYVIGTVTDGATKDWGSLLGLGSNYSIEYADGILTSAFLGDIVWASPEDDDITWGGTDNWKMGENGYITIGSKDDVVLGPIAEGSGISSAIVINAAVAVGSVTVQDEYSFSVAEGESYGFDAGTIVLEEGGSLSKVGTGTLSMSVEDAVAAQMNIAAGTLSISGTLADYDAGTRADLTALSGSGTLSITAAGTSGATGNGTGQRTAVNLADSFTGTLAVVGGNLDMASTIGRAGSVLLDGATLVGTGSVVQELGWNIAVSDKGAYLRRFGNINSDERDSYATRLTGSLTGSAETMLTVIDSGEWFLAGDMSAYQGGLSINGSANYVTFESSASLASLSAVDGSHILVDNDATLTAPSLAVSGTLNTGATEGATFNMGAVTVAANGTLKIDGTGAHNISALSVANNSVLELTAGTNAAITDSAAHGIGNGNAVTIKVGEGATLTDSGSWQLTGSTMTVQGGGEYKLNSLVLSANQAGKTTVNVESGTTLHITGTATNNSKLDAAFGLGHWNADNAVNVRGVLELECGISSYSGYSNTTTITVENGGKIAFNDGLHAAGKDNAGVININGGGVLEVSGTNVTGANLVTVNIAREGIVLGGNANGATESVIANDLISAQGFYVGAAAGTTLTLAPESGNLTFGNTSSWINVLGTADNQGGKVVFDVQDLVLNALTVQSGASASIVSDATLYVNSYGGIVVAENATLSFDGAGEITLGQAIKNAGTVEILNAADTQFVLSNALMQEVAGVSKTWTLVNNTGVEGLTGTIKGWDELGLGNFLLDGSALQQGDWDDVRIEDGKVMLYMLSRYWDATGDDGVWNTGADANWREFANSTETVTFETNSRVTFTDTDETGAALDKSVTVADGGVHAKSVTITGSDYVFRGGKVLVNQSLSAQQNARFDSAVVIGSSAPLQLDVAVGATLTLSTLETVSTQSYGGVSYGSGAFSKTGEGTLLITDAINGTITGATVSGGKLVLGVAGAEDVAKTVSLAVGSNTLTTAGGSLENVELLSSGTVVDYKNTEAHANNVIKSEDGENYAMLTDVALQAGAATGYASLQKVAFAGNSTLSGYITYESTKQQRQMAVATGGTLTVSNLTFDLHGLSAGTKVLIENSAVADAAEGFKGTLLGWNSDNVTLLYSGIAVNSATVNMNTAGVVELLTAENNEASRLYWDGLVAGAAEGDAPVASSAWDKSSANWSTTAGTNGSSAFLALSNTYFGATPERGSKTVNAAQDMVMSNMFVTEGGYSFTGSRLATLGNMHITPASGAVSFANELVAQGNVTLSAAKGGSLSFAGMLQAGGTITANVAGALSFDNAVSAGVKVELNAQNLEVNGALRSAGDVSISSGTTTAGGAGSLTIGESGSITGANVTINVNAGAESDTHYRDYVVESAGAITATAEGGKVSFTGNGAAHITGTVTADEIVVDTQSSNGIIFRQLDTDTLTITEGSYAALTDETSTGQQETSRIGTIQLGGRLGLTQFAGTYSGYNLVTTSATATVDFATIAKVTFASVKGEQLADGTYGSIVFNDSYRELTVNKLETVNNITFGAGEYWAKLNNASGAIHGNLTVRGGGGLYVSSDDIMANGSGKWYISGPLYLQGTTQTLAGNAVYLDGAVISGTHASGMNYTADSQIHYTGNNTISANMTVADGKVLTIEAGNVPEDIQAEQADILTLNGNLNGNGDVLLTGSGRVSLGAANAFTGSMTVQNHTQLSLDNTQALASANLLLNPNGVLIVDRSAVETPFTIGALTLGGGALQINNLMAMDAVSAKDAALKLGALITRMTNTLDLTLSFTSGELQTMKTYNLFTADATNSLADIAKLLNLNLSVVNGTETLPIADNQYKLVYDADSNVIAIRTMLGNIWDGGADGDGDGIWSTDNTHKNWSGSDYDQATAFNDAIFADLTGEGIGENAVVTIQGTVNPGDVYFEADTTDYVLNATDTGAMLGAGNVIHKAGAADVTLNLANNGTVETALGGMDLQAGNTTLAANVAVAGEVSVAAGATLQTGANTLLMVGGNGEAYTAQGTYSGLTMDATGIAGVADALGVVTNGIIDGAAELNYLNLTGTGKLTNVTIGSGLNVAASSAYTLNGHITFLDTLQNAGTVTLDSDATVEIGSLSYTYGMAASAEEGAQYGVSAGGSYYKYQLIQGGTINGMQDLTVDDVYVNGVKLGGADSGLADGMAAVFTNNDGELTLSIGAITSGDGEKLTVDGSVGMPTWDERWGKSSAEPALSRHYAGTAADVSFVENSGYLYSAVVKDAATVNDGKAVVVTLSSSAAGDRAAGGSSATNLDHEIWMYDRSGYKTVIAGQYAGGEVDYTQTKDTHVLVNSTYDGADEGTAVDQKTWVVGGSWNVDQQANSYVTVQNGNILTLVGGSYGANQDGSTHVYVDGGTIAEVFAGGFNGDVASSNLTITGGTLGLTTEAVNKRVYGGSYYGTVHGDVNVTVEGDATITKLVGGGYHGAVEDDITINLLSGTVTERVDAAGVGDSSVTGDVLVNLTQGFNVTGGLYGGKQSDSGVTLNGSSTLAFVSAGETYDLSAIAVQGFDTFTLADGTHVKVSTQSGFATDTASGVLTISGLGKVELVGNTDLGRDITLTDGATLWFNSDYAGNAIGTQDSRRVLTATAGTTIEITGQPTNGDGLCVWLDLTGHGADGKGALYKALVGAETTPAGKVALPKVTLSDSASVNAEDNIYFIDYANYESELILKGNTLTKVGEADLVLYNSTVTDTSANDTDTGVDGTIFVKEGTLGTGYGMRAAKTNVVLSSGSELNIIDIGEADTNIGALSGSGSVALNKGLVITTSSAGSYGKGSDWMTEGADAYSQFSADSGFAYGVYSGTISGSNSLSVKGDAVQYLSGSESTFSGGVHMYDSATLYLMSGTSGSAVQGNSTVTAGVVGTGAIAWDSHDAKLYLGNGVQVYNAGTTNVANSNMIIGVEAAPHGDALSNYVGVNSKGADGVLYITVGGKEYVEIDTHNLQSITCDGMYADGTAYVAGTEIDRNKMLLVEKSVWELNTATVAGFSAGGYNTATYSGVLSGNANLVKVGLGTLILDQTNTYTGKTIIREGSLVLKGWAQIGGSADSAALNVEQAAGSTLMLAYDGTYGNEITEITNDIAISGTGDVRWTTEAATNKATAALISSVSGQTPFTLSGDISGGGNLLHCGSGTLVLSGDSSFTGGMHATRGVVEVQSATGLGAGAVKIDSTADLHVTVEEGTTASRVVTTLAAAGTTVQGDVVISGTESTERILNVATGGYDAPTTTVNDNGTLLVNGAGVAASTGTLSGSGTVAVSDATGSGAKAEVHQMTAYTGDFVVEGNNASITVDNGNYSGGSISVSGNDAVLSTKGDITITNGESLSLSSRGNAGSETADSAYVTTTGAVSVAGGATLSVSDAATSYDYNLQNLQNLQAAASLNGVAALKDGVAGELHGFGANVDPNAEDAYSGFFNTSVAMNQKAAGAVDAKGGLTMASGATYETAMANTSLMGGSLTLESGLTLSTTLDLGQGAIDGAGRTTQLVLFSDVNSVNFVLDNLTAVADADGGIYYTKAENYISGSYIDEDTWLVYDSGAGVVYLDGIVPEPTTATLSLLALAALAARRRRR